MINGIINVYKERGFTSHDVVAKLRGILKQKKIGHTGTLDPEAEGVLPVCLGKATKVCDMLTEKDKVYETVLLLGEKTDTQDKEIEEVFQELDTIAEKLESGETSLEDSFRLYKKGMELLKYCSDRLDTVEKKMLQMDEDGILREF